MIPVHLTGYVLLCFDSEVVLFLENPTIGQPCAGLSSGAPNRTKSTIGRRKPLFKDIETSYIIWFSATGIPVFHMYICRLQWEFVRWRATCAAGAQNRNIHMSVPFDFNPVCKSCSWNLFEVTKKELKKCVLEIAALLHSEGEVGSALLGQSTPRHILCGCTSMDFRLSLCLNDLHSFPPCFSLSGGFTNVRSPSD